jgi:tetratricopeptide (TPR) repeat protein
MIEGARETPAGDAAIYPLMLDLQVEHWRALAAQGRSIEPAAFNVAASDFAGRRREIVERVLRDYGEPMQKTLMRLSCARRFDRAAFEHLVKTFHTGLPLDVFDSIDNLSFLIKGEGGFVSMHGIMADAIREILDRATRTATLQALFEHFDARAKGVSHRDVTSDTVMALAEAAEAQLRIAPAAYVEWLGPAVKPLQMAARYGDAAELWRKAVIVTEQHFGPDHPDTALSLNNFGDLLEAQGDLAGARPYYERALGIREKALSSDNPDTATSLNDLGALLLAQGDLAGARPYLERALAIRERALGLNHPDTARTLSNLGALLDSQDDLAGARPYYERAVDINEKARGPDHPDTARSLNDLGYLLEAQGDLAGARPYYQRALDIKEKALGLDHPDTATSLNNLGHLLHAQGDLAGARPYFERALAIREKALGPDHPLTANSLNNLGGLLHAQDDLVGARPYYERALGICEMRLGPDHSHTRIVRENLAKLSTS